MVSESPIVLLIVLISVTAVLLGICTKLFIRAAQRGESYENDSSIQGYLTVISKHQISK